jgi:hypothetical protein
MPNTMPARRCLVLDCLLLQNRGAVGNAMVRSIRHNSALKAYIKA